MAKSNKPAPKTLPPGSGSKGTKKGPGQKPPAKKSGTAK
jgi:hypothetical protein